MAQHDYSIADSNGATVRADINSAFQAGQELNSGATAPTTTFAYQWWADTANALLKQRNSTNTAWLTRAILGDLRYDSVLGTEQASTSGTSIDFTGIPSWAKRITINLVGVSTSGTDILMVQIGDSGGVEATGYLSSVAAVTATPSVGLVTTGFGLTANHAAAAILHGRIVLELEDSANFTWTSKGILGRSDSAVVYIGGGSKSLSSVLDRVRITTSGGTDTFDAGDINIIYE